MTTQSDRTTTRQQHAEAIQDRRWWCAAWHPYAFCLIPVLAVYANHTAETTLMTAMATALLFLCTTWGCVSLLSRVFPGVPHAAAATSLIIGLTFGYWRLQSIAAWPIRLHYATFPQVRLRYFLVVWFIATVVVWISNGWGGKPNGNAWLPSPLIVVSFLYLALALCSQLGYVPYAWLAVMLALLVWLRGRSFPANRRVVFSLNLVAVIAFAGCCTKVGQAWARSRAMDRQTDLFVAAIDQEEIHLQRPEELRDIYYIVLDRYASNQTLNEHLRFDNSLFSVDLKARGFHFAPDSRANYPKTVISLSSALNLRYHGDLLLESAAYERQLREQRVCRLLQQQGYIYYHLGNHYSDVAEVNFRYTLFPSEFADDVYELTPLADVYPSRFRPEVLLRQFDQLASVATDDRPTYTFAHFRLPHPPYLFTQDGSIVPPEQRMPMTSEKYFQQLIFTNHTVLKTVDRILEESGRTPIIVIQSDEGPFLWAEDRNQDSLAKLRKRTGIISAFLLPDIDTARVVPSDISPVNTFRLIFREYFAAKIDLLENRTYYWQHATRQGSPSSRSPNRFIDVTERLRESGA